MPLHHSIEYNLRIREASNRTSVVYLAKAPNRKLIIFVHGFGGHPIKTWHNFPALALTSPEMAGYDLIFYNYDSKGVQAKFSGDALGDFIGELTSQHNYLQNLNYALSAYNRADDFGYNKILLVAHSLGSIVCRNALLRSKKMSKSWHDHTTMLLFAPAHMGAKLLKLIPPLFFTKALGFVAGIIRYHCVTMDDVDLSLKDCSLNYLIEDTRTIQAAPNHDFTVAKTVISAEHEKIVNTNDFLLDPPHVPAYGKYHTDVCKPTPNYTDPLKHLINALP